MFTTAQAIGNLFLGSREDHEETCYYVCKDVYGYRDDFARYTYEELISFFLSVYDWNEETQRWDFKQWIRDQETLEREWLEEMDRELEEERTNPWVLMCRDEE